MTRRAKKAKDIWLIVTMNGYPIGAEHPYYCKDDARRNELKGERVVRYTPKPKRRKR